MTNKMITTAGFLKGSRVALALMGAGVPAISSAGPVTGSVEHIQSAEKDLSYQRGNFFYALPGNTKGYTFLEAYEDGSAFAKTILTKKLDSNVSAISHVRHINEGLTDAGIGLKFSVPFKKTDDGRYASAALLPFWVDSSGNHMPNRVILGLSAGKNLTDKISVGAFGEMNLGSKNGAEWAYGEGFAMYKANKDWSFGYNPALRNNGKGKIVPRVEHRFAVQRRF